MTTQQLPAPAPSRHVVRNVLAFVAGVVAAPFLSTLLYRAGAPEGWPEAFTPFAFVVAALRRGTVRWAVAGLGVGVLAFAAFMLWLFTHFEGLGEL